MIEVAPATPFLNGLDTSVPPRADTGWGGSDSPFENYELGVLLASGQTLEQCIAQRLQLLDDNVGLDIAGGTNGRALRHLMDAGILARGLVTNFEDRRSAKAIEDGRLGHVAGDIRLQKTWDGADGISEWRQQHAPQGFSLVLHRPDGALQDLPVDFYMNRVHASLDQTRPGGMFVGTIPQPFHDLHPRAARALYRSIIERSDVELPPPRELWHSDQLLNLFVMKRPS